MHLLRLVHFLFVNNNEKREGKFFILQIKENVLYNFFTEDKKYEKTYCLLFNFINDIIIAYI